jgi:predicted ATPase/DNA-binding SARP family transcriptional activator
MLVVHAKHRVAVDELAAAVWGDRPVSGASLDSQIWRLRRVLGAGGTAEPTPVVHDAGGYRLVLGPEAIDSSRFERLKERSTRSLRTGTPRDCVRQVDEALSLWRGRPYEILTEHLAAAAAAARLEEVHAQLLETRIDALLQLGELEPALVDLEPLIAQMPFREHLWHQRMVALASCGRTEEALDTYLRFRTLLCEEVGVDPSRDLQQLHQRILRGELQPTTQPGPLDVPDDHETVLEPTPSAGHLPRRNNAFIGREEDCARLPQLLARCSPVTVIGPGGTGKTRLALEVARRVAPSFPDGVWFVGLTAVTDPVAVAAVVISALGLGVGPEEDALGSLVAFAGSCQALVVIDNCEHLLGAVADLVETMNIDSGRLRMLATSREPLGIDGELVWPLSPLPLTPPTDHDEEQSVSPAARLFLERAAAAAPQLRLRDGLPEIEHVCRTLDGLPLAIELAAARVCAFSVGEIARQVADRPNRLISVNGRTASHHDDLDATIDWSYRLLNPAEQQLHRCLSTLAGPFTAEAAAAAAGVADCEVVQLLAQLTHRCLLVAEPAAGPQAISTFRQLATVRAHAAQRLSGSMEAGEASERRDAWVRTLLARRPRLGHADEKAWFVQLEADYATIRLVLNERLTQPADPTWLSLGGGMMCFWYFRSRLHEGGSWLSAAIDGWAPDLDPAEMGKARLRMAVNLLLQNRPDQAQTYVDAGLAQVTDRQTSDRDELSEILVALATTAWGINDIVVLHRAHRLLDQVADHGDPDMLLHLDAVAAVVDLHDKDLPEVARCAEVVYRRAEQLNNHWDCRLMSALLAQVALRTNQPDDGIRWTGKLLQRDLEFGRGGSSLALETLANLAVLAGDLRRAARNYSLAESEAQHAGLTFPSSPATSDLLRRAQRGLRPADFQHEWLQGRHQSLNQIADELTADRPASAACSR